MQIVKIIIGDDFTFILDCDESGVDGKPKLKTFVKNSISLHFILCDFMSIRNLESKCPHENEIIH